MKTILLLVHEDEGQEARFQAALDLARGLDAHIRCADITPLTIMPVDGGWATGMALAEGRKLQIDLREHLEVRLAAEGVRYDWVDDIGDIALSLARHARLADLIVFNCKRPRLFDRDTRGVVGDVVIEARRPVLAVPDRAIGLDLTGAALVAWDGSEPAAEALRAAAPLLALARSVRLLAVGEPKAGPSAQAAAGYLSRYGVHADVTVVEAGGETPDAHLLRQAETDRAGYCVMGLYGHGRLSESLFGGVSRRMIETARIPLFLAR